MDKLDARKYLDLISFQIIPDFLDPRIFTRSLYTVSQYLNKDFLTEVNQNIYNDQSSVVKHEYKFMIKRSLYSFYGSSITNITQKVCPNAF